MTSGPNGARGDRAAERRARARRVGAGVALAALLAVAGCSSGPTDFLDEALDAPATTAAAHPAPLSADQRDALEQDLLAAADRQTAAGSSAGAAIGSPLALSAIGQRQSEAAKALVEETRAGAPTPGPADPRVIPGGVPILCADGQPVAADGLCPVIR